MASGLQRFAVATDDGGDSRAAATAAGASASDGTDDCAVPIAQTESLFNDYQQAAPERIVRYEARPGGLHIVGGGDDDGCPSDGGIFDFLAELESANAGP